MTPSSFDFRVGSLNIRGINKHTKRMATFNWIKSKQFDVMFLQETYSSKADENLWRSEWGGPAFWCRGSKHSCGVSVLIRRGFDMDPVEIIADPKGRFLIIKANVQGEMLCMINIYAPNTDNEKVVFFKQLHDELTKSGITRNDCVLIGGILC